MQVALDSDAGATGLSIDAESSDFLRRMAGLVPGIIYIFNHKTRSNEYSNRSIGTMLGYTPQELIDLGDALFETIVHEDDLDGLAAYFDSLGELADGVSATHEYRDYARDGSVVWLRSIDKVYERDTDGSVLRHIGIAIDITDQKLTEERLRATRRELEQLTYIASHDLKVPVSNMSTLTHMLSEAGELLPPEHSETLGWMRDVCTQAQEKLDALVCVAQANAGEMAPFEPVGLAAVTENVLVSLHCQITDSNAVIRTDFEVPEVTFLPRELENMLQAMIANAIRYRSPDRRVRIKVTSRSVDNMTEISVADNGTGLDLPRDEGKVFDLFRRAHAVPGGAGVALYTIRCLMHRIGGTIRVEGSPGEGAVFTLSFPQSGA